MKLVLFLIMFCGLTETALAALAVLAEGYAPGSGLSVSQAFLVGFVSLLGASWAAGRFDRMEKEDKLLGL